MSSASEHRLTAPIYGYICLHTYMGIYVYTQVYMFKHALPHTHTHTHTQRGQVATGGG